MTLRRYLALLLVVAFAAAVTSIPVFARQGNNADPNANILWPPPVFAVSGSMTVIGTANPPGISGYFLEFRRLRDDGTAQDSSAPWSPAILPVRTPVIQGVLGVWDTTQIQDGLYELRLSVFTNTVQPIQTVVSPLRVLNHPPSFAGIPNGVFTTPPPQIIVVPDTPTPFFQPTQNTNVTSPMAVAVTDANVRTGDSTLYPAIGALLRGQPAPVIGVSSRGSGWWLIVLADGRQGWIAPSTVRVTGTLGGIPAIDPPPTPTPTATPTPIATATPTLPNATITVLRFDRTPKQGELFNVVVTVLNASLSPLPRITVACSFTPMNKFVTQTLESLSAFGQIDLNIPVTLDSGGGQSMTVNCVADSNNQVAEISEGDNFASLTATLTEP